MSKNIFPIDQPQSSVDYIDATTETQENRGDRRFRRRVIGTFAILGAALGGLYGNQLDGREIRGSAAEKSRVVEAQQLCLTAIEQRLATGDTVIQLSPDDEIVRQCQVSTNDATDDNTQLTMFGGLTAPASGLEINDDTAAYLRGVIDGNIAEAEKVEQSAENIHIFMNGEPSKAVSMAFTISVLAAASGGALMYYLEKNDGAPSRRREKNR